MSSKGESGRGSGRFRPLLSFGGGDDDENKKKDAKESFSPRPSPLKAVAAMFGSLDAAKVPRKDAETPQKPGMAAQDTSDLIAQLAFLDGGMIPPPPMSAAPASPPVVAETGANSTLSSRTSAESGSRDRSLFSGSNDVSAASSTAKSAAYQGVVAAGDEEPLEEAIEDVKESTAATETKDGAPPVSTQSFHSTEDGDAESDESFLLLPGAIPTANAVLSFMDAEGAEEGVCAEDGAIVVRTEVLEDVALSKEGIAADEEAFEKESVAAEEEASSGAAEEEAAAGSAEKDTAAGASENETAAGASENETAAGAAEKETAAGVAGGEEVATEELVAFEEHVPAQIEQVAESTEQQPATADELFKQASEVVARYTEIDNVSVTVSTPYMVPSSSQSSEEAMSDGSAVVGRGVVDGESSEHVTNSAVLENSAIVSLEQPQVPSPLDYDVAKSKTATSSNEIAETPAPSVPSEEGPMITQDRCLFPTSSPVTRDLIPTSTRAEEETNALPLKTKTTEHHVVIFKETPSSSSSELTSYRTLILVATCILIQFFSGFVYEWTSTTKATGILLHFSWFVVLFVVFFLSLSADTTTNTAMLKR